MRKREEEEQAWEEPLPEEGGAYADEENWPHVFAENGTRTASSSRIPANRPLC